MKQDNKLATLYPKDKFYISILLILTNLVLSTLRFTEMQLPICLFIFSVFLFFLFIVTGIIHQSMKTLINIFLFSLMIFSFQVLFVPQGNIIFTFLPFNIYDTSIRNGITLGMNTFNLSCILLWYFQTTSIESITCMLNQSGVNHKISYTILSTFQMIDTLNQKTKKIISSQKCRGIEIEGNIFQRAKAFIPVLFPAFITSLIEIENQAIMLESKNFFISGPRTHLKKIDRNGYESFFLKLFILLFGLSITGSIYYGICF